MVRTNFASKLPVKNVKKFTCSPLYMMLQYYSKQDIALCNVHLKPVSRINIAINKFFFRILRSVETTNIQNSSMSHPTSTTL